MLEDRLIEFKASMSPLVSFRIVLIFELCRRLFVLIQDRDLIILVLTVFEYLSESIQCCHAVCFVIYFLFLFHWRLNVIEDNKSLRF